jgi:dTDP-4-amino-4,6-dideoxygalactose transaminase
VIPFVNLQAQYLSIKPELDAVVARVLASGRWTLGPEVAAFEQEFAAFCGVRYAVGVNSGTSALHLALLACGVGPESEVITTPFTFVATAAAILYTGARPIFVDIDPVSYTIDVSRIEAAITRKTRVILPVHLYGRAADLMPILDIAQRHNLAIIEDASQAHGATYQGRHVGGFGDIGCFSFYPAKNLGACGEAGVLITNSADHARTARRLRDWGCEQRYHHELLGFNYRMEELQAAVLRVKLRHLPTWLAARRRHAVAYQRQLADCPLMFPVGEPDEHAYHVYAVQCANRDKLQRDLHERGIETLIHYPIPVHVQKAYADLGYRRGDFPAAESLAGRELSLPVSPELSIEEQESVCCTLKQLLPRTLARG